MDVIVRTLGAGVLAASLAVGLAAAPSTATLDDTPRPSERAKRPDGAGKKTEPPRTVQTKTVLWFNKSVKRALAEDGITVAAVAPATKRNAVKFAFPAEAMADAISHQGGLALKRGEKSLTITDFAFDLSGKTVDLTVPDVGTVEDALTLKRVKVTTKKKVVLTRVGVADGTAAVLNEALGSDLFSDGMFLAKTRTK
jgi:hypothetical protein